MQAILAFIAIIPRLLTLAERLGTLVEQHRVEEWLDELESSIASLESARTVEDKRNAARSIARVIARGRLR